MPHQRHKGADMILYELRCANGHNFEAWFRDSAAYDTQAKDLRRLFEENFQQFESAVDDKVKAVAIKAAA